LEVLPLVPPTNLENTEYYLTWKYVSTSHPNRNSPPFITDKLSWHEDIYISGTGRTHWARAVKFPVICIGISFPRA